MVTKQQTAVNRAFSRGKNKGKVREEKHLLALLTAAIIILLYLLLAQHNAWWPFSRQDLGSAFYTNVSPATTAPSGLNGSSTTGSGSSGSSGSTGSSSTGSGSNGGSTGSGSGGSTGTGSIANFAAGVNVGDTMAQTNARANGLNPSCALVVNASASGAGKQQVCTYTQGDKIVTVTYLNGHVISASKSGF